MGLRLTEFEAEVLHRSGAQNVVSDELSRLPTTGMKTSLPEDDVPMLTITEVHPEGEKTKTNAKTGIVSPVMKDWTL